MYRLFSSCIPVKGASRSCILDLQRNDIHLIPNSLYDIITNNNGNIDFNFLLKNYANMEDIINEYKSFLISNELIFYCDSIEESNCFPNIYEDYDSPYKITNMIVDISNYYTKDILHSINKSINIIGIQALQIRVFTKSLDIADYLLNLIEGDSRLSYVGLLVNYYSGCEIFIDKILKNERINIIEIYGTDKTFQDCRIHTYDYIIDGEKSCGKIEGNISDINTEIYFESINCNSCLNRKISIDSNGLLKNCPSMRDSFGNIKDTLIEDVIDSSSLKKYWNITKDEIEICKDCEFRYICTDCRAYTERNHITNGDIDLSKPLKCGYNPYTATWTDWKKSKIKQKAIKYYEI